MMGYFNTARKAECDEHADPLSEGHRTFEGSREADAGDDAPPREGAAHDSEQEGY
jgi:hypothetical protein